MLLSEISLKIFVKKSNFQTGSIAIILYDDLFKNRLSDLQT